MQTLLAHLVLLAEQEAAPQTGFNPLFMLFIVVLVFLFITVVYRPAKREQAVRKDMLNNLKKNDRVLTSAGIKGTVANVHREANEVTVNVDESTGTKIRFTIDAIVRVETSKTDKIEEEKK